MRMVLTHAENRHGLFRKVAGALGARDDDRAAAVGLQSTIEQTERLADKARSLVIGDGHRLAHGGVAIHAGMFPCCDRDVGEIFACGAELVHMALRGESVIGDGGEMAPGLFPMLVAVADRIARRRIGRAALARMHA